VSEVLYRKWRPQSFAEVSGQEPITRTLRNSVASGRLAHAYLFCGPRGTGKTTLGRLLAKAANCTSPIEGEPCNECESCRSYNEGRAMDFVEQDAASHNSVDDIRQLRENVVLTPMGEGGRKVYLLDEVHMLSTAAENALLKTLEEPPPHIMFVLATTDPQKVSTTIISRCQRFDLKRIPLPAVIGRLKQVSEAEGYTLDETSLGEIGRSATGSLRDAINSLEQVVMYYGPSPDLSQVREALGLTVDARAGQLARLAFDKDLAGGLKLIGEVRDDGVDMREFTKQLVRYLRGVLLQKAGVAESLDLPADSLDAVKEHAGRMSRVDVVRALRTFGGVDFKDDAQSSLPLELALIEFVSSDDREGVAEEPAPASAERAEPRFSIPRAELDEVASDVDSARMEEDDGPEPEKPEAARETVTPAEAAPSGEVLQTGDVIEQVRLACKDTDKQLSALLNGSCELKSIEGDTVVLGFFHTFHLERVDDPGSKKRLRELFSQVMDRDVDVQLEHWPRERPEPPKAKGGHLVQAARELGARPAGRSTIPEGGTDGEGQ
jgi:DNA polymerase-3 subunit gamma/tau